MCASSVSGNSKNRSYLAVPIPNTAQRQTALLGSSISSRVFKEVILCSVVAGQSNPEISAGSYVSAGQSDNPPACTAPGKSSTFPTTDNYQHSYPFHPRCISDQHFSVYNTTLITEHAKGPASAGHHAIDSDIPEVKLRCNFTKPCWPGYIHLKISS